MGEISDAIYDKMFNDDILGKNWKETLGAMVNQKN